MSANCTKCPRETDTESSHQQTGTTEPKKLKASCDFCALSKVKCDRRQPQCLRCIRNEVECHYSEVRRTGKARRIYAASTASNTDHAREQPKDYQATGTDSCTSRPRTTSNSSRDSAHVTPKSSDHTMTMDISMGLLDNAEFLSGLGKTNAHPNLHFADSHPHILEGPDFLESLAQHMDTEPDDMQGIQEMHMQYSCAEPSFGFAMAELPTESLSFTPSPHNSRDAGNCMKRALPVLESLHLPVEPCSLPGNAQTASGNHGRGLDGALKTYRTAIEAVRQMLSCDCARSWNMFLLIGLITLQLMESYLTLVQLQMSRHGSSEREFAAVEEAKRSIHGLSPAFDAPMAIGEYVLDQEMRDTVILHVLKSGILEVHDLIDTLVSRYNEGAYDEPRTGLMKAFIQSLQDCQNKASQDLLLDGKRSI